MDRRKEPRLKLNRPVTLTVLDPVLGAKGSHGIEGFVLDVSGSGMMLRMPKPVPCGVAVQIEDEHTLSLGEICRCERENEQGSYNVGVLVSQVYTPMGDLGRLNDALTRFDTPSRVPVRARS